MGDYAQTTTSLMKRAIKIDAVVGIGMFAGVCNLTNYNSVLAEITAITKKFRTLHYVLANSVSSGGFLARWDTSSKAFKAYYPTPTSSMTFTGVAEAPQLVVEEVVAISGNTGTLAWIPAYIVGMEVTAASSVTGAFNIIPTGETPITKQCDVNFTDGVLTFLGTDGVTSVRVTYFPQKVGTIFDSGNLVVDEVKVASDAKVDLTNRAMCVQYVWNDTSGLLVSSAAEPPGETPSATNTCVLDINDSGDSSIDTITADNGDSLKVTYIKFSALESPTDFIDDTDITLTGDPEQFDFIEEGNFPNLIVPGFGTHLVGEETANNHIMTWTGPSGSSANGLAVWRPGKNQIETQETTALTDTTISWFQLHGVTNNSETPVGSVAISATAADEANDDETIGTIEFIAIGLI